MTLDSARPPDTGASLIFDTYAGTLHPHNQNGSPPGWEVRAQPKHGFAVPV
jgi:hypothetical protein